MMLIITNGDGAVAALKAGGIRAAYLPWRDVLHEGPVPGGLTHEELSRTRAKFIAERGWGTFDAVAEDFARRDRRLANARHHREIVLWFEHDLYDQLQLLQLLHWFAAAPPEGAALDLICRREYVGEVDPAVARARLDQRLPVSEGMLARGREAWRAFTAETPEAWVPLAQGIGSVLPFLGSAFHRLLEELPSVEHGLSRSEAQILRAVHDGVATPGALFRACQQFEDAVFMGDSSFFTIMHDLTIGEHAALARQDGEPLAYPPPHPLTRQWLEQPLTLTAAGRGYLAGKVDWVTRRGIDRWLGGIHLTGPSVWRWNAETGGVVRTV